MKRLFDRHIKRLAFATLGVLFFVTGLIGVFLPILPTTPFMLLALWAFSNSSQRLHDYVWHHKSYGPMVRAWKEHGAIPLRAKISALALMATSAPVLIFVSPAPLYAIVAALLLMATGATYILTRPTLRQSPSPTTKR